MQFKKSYLLFFGLFLFLANCSHAAERTLTFGVVPQQSPTKLLRSWGPVLEHLGQKVGYEIEFKTAPDIPTFETRLSAGEYDLAYMNPYHFTVFNEFPGYKAVARAKDKQIKGIIVVSHESELSEISELRNTTFAFPAPAAFAATLLIQGALKQKGIDIKSAFVNSHDSVYRTVAKNIYSAGGGVRRTFNLMDSSVSDSLKILWTTDGYTPHAIAAHPRVPTELRNEIVESLISIGANDQTVNIKKLLGIKGFVAAEDSDWDDVRSLNLSALLSR